VTVGCVVDQYNAGAETIPARQPVQQQAEIDDRNDFAAITEESSQERRCVGDWAELNVGHELDDASHIDSIAVRTG
jgi:hypothetical protein